METEEHYDNLMKQDYDRATYLRLVRIHSYPYGHEARLPDIVEEIYYRVRITKKEIFNIGELLVEAKQIVGHGNFKKWIADYFDFSYETAKNFMNVYAACLAEPDVVTTMKASVLYRISAPGFPEDLREYIFEQGDISLSRVDDFWRKDKTGELDLESEEVRKTSDGDKCGPSLPMPKTA